MSIIAALVLQSYAGLSSQGQYDEWLQFVFVNDRHAEAKIIGQSSSPMSWSTRAVYKMVKQCGGERMRVSGGGSRIVVRAASTGRNLEIAKCVQASTSARFRVGVREIGFGSAGFDEQPFKDLWSS
jgi:hypothetical protein